ncbi:MAG: acyloxyacyl hydrolase [Alphaproteobacteria bacterium]|nr:acyloxyacyl hydrolase [Alphaproteobacteria bacterium]
MRRLLAIACVGATALLLAAPAGADGALHEVKAGLLAHDVDGLWSGTSRESGIDGNLEVILAPSLPLAGGAVRPALGVSLNSAGDASKAYADARWEIDLGEALWFATGIGAAIHNGERRPVRNDRKALGSQVLFHFPIELGLRLDAHNSVSLFFDHISNAWLASPNEGMDTLGVRYGYRF